MKTRKTSGFTLIELLIVVVIIGILAAIAIPKFSAVREKAFKSSMISDLKNLASLQEVYYNENFTYSLDPVAVGFQNSDGVSVSIEAASNLGWGVVATHAGLTNGESCGFFQGDGGPAGPATLEGVTTCNF